MMENNRPDIILNQTLPHNDECEKGIISVCLTASFAAKETLAYAVKYIKPEYFYRSEYADSFRVILDMVNGTYGVPVPVPDFMSFTIAAKTNAEKYETFRAMYAADPAQIDAFAIEIVSEPPYNGRFLASQLIDLYKRREQWRIGVEFQRLSNDADDTTEKRVKLNEELAELELIGNERYAAYFVPSTLAATSAALRNQGDGLATGYTLGKEQRGQIIRRDFKIPRNQLTVIAAATGHGKSTFCYNLALRLIARNKRPDEKPVKVLYLSYEESTQNIEPKIINVMTGLNLAEDNRAAIAADLANGGTGAFINDPKLCKEYREKVSDYYAMAAAETLTVKYCDLDAAELCALIREYRKRDAADVVIIDYIQLLEKESSKAHGRNRPDELKEICADLRKLANDETLGLPVIIASQFNREVQKSNDPRTMDKTNLGESANIEHSANIILGLWNCQETNVEKYTAIDKDGIPTGKLTADGERLLQYQHTKHIDDPFIYARLLKSREGINGLNVTLNYYGNCGRIENTGDTTPNERAGLKRDELTEPRNTYSHRGDDDNTTDATPNNNAPKQKEIDLPFF